MYRLYTHHFTRRNILGYDVHIYSTYIYIYIYIYIHSIYIYTVYIYTVYIYIYICNYIYVIIYIIIYVIIYVYMLECGMTCIYCEWTFCQHFPYLWLCLNIKRYLLDKFGFVWKRLLYQKNAISLRKWWWSNGIEGHGLRFDQIIVVFNAKPTIWWGYSIGLSKLQNGSEIPPKKHWHISRNQYTKPIVATVNFSHPILAL